jgi:hypothetical protein
MMYGQDQIMSQRSTGEQSARRLQAAQARDAALTRVGSARRLTIAGSAGLSAGFAALVWALAPGHSLTSAKAATQPAAGTRSQSGATSPAAASAMPAPASPQALGLGSGSFGDGAAASAPSSAPASAPAPASAAPTPQVVQPAAPSVVSGGS